MSHLSLQRNFCADLSHNVIEQLSICSPRKALSFGDFEVLLQCARTAWKVLQFRFPNVNAKRSKCAKNVRHLWALLHQFMNCRHSITLPYHLLAKRAVEHVFERYTFNDTDLLFDHQFRKVGCDLPGIDLATDCNVNDFERWRGYPGVSDRSSCIRGWFEEVCPVASKDFRLWSKFSCQRSSGEIAPDPQLLQNLHHCMRRVDACSQPTVPDELAVQKCSNFRHNDPAACEIVRIKLSRLHKLPIGGKKIAIALFGRLERRGIVELNIPTIDTKASKHRFQFCDRTHFLHLSYRQSEGLRFLTLAVYRSNIALSSAKEKTPARRERGEVHGAESNSGMSRRASSLLKSTHDNRPGF
jgi:hypothetical protein